MSLTRISCFDLGAKHAGSMGLISSNGYRDLKPCVGNIGQSAHTGAYFRSDLTYSLDSVFSSQLLISAVMVLEDSDMELVFEIEVSVSIDI